MTTTQFTTPRDLLRYAVTRFNGARLFFGHGSVEAFDEAAYLILHTLKLPLDKLEPFLDAKLLPDEVLQVLAVVERRAVERVPAAYITNEAWLGTYAFYVDERVLVPRSFIAELVHGIGLPGDHDGRRLPEQRSRCGRHFARCAGGRRT
jgi:ribosomal protein L3 glutamine methyltransferase